MSDEEKIQIAALGLLGLFNRKPKSRKSTPETKEDPGVIEPDSSDSSDPEDSDDDKLPDGPGAGSPPRRSGKSGGRSPPRESDGSGGRSPPRRSGGSGGRRQSPEQEETTEQEETPQQKLDRIKSNPNAKMILLNIGILFDEIDRNKDGFIQLRELVIAIKRNKRVQRIFGIDSIREGRNNNYVVELFRKIDTYPPDDQLSKDELILFLFRKENIQMLNMLKATTEAIVLALNLYDANRDGKISRPELARGYEQQGETIEDARKDARDFLMLRDINMDDELDPSEFARSLVFGEGRPPAWFTDMVNDSFERAQNGQLLLKDMARPYGDMQPGRNLDDPKPIPPQREPIEPPYDGPEQPPEPLTPAPFEPEKKKKAKEKTGEKGEHHATQAKARAKQILRDAGVMIENDDGTVEYKIDQTNISAWERVIEDISALDKKQAFSLLYQAVLKGMYKDTRTSNISLKDLRSGKVLKPGGFEKYIGDYLTKPNKRGLRQVDQYKAATIATLIIDDLKKGINLFNEHKPRGRGTSSRGKASGKAKSKKKKPSEPAPNPLALLPILEPAVPSAEDISKLIEDEIGSSSSSDESDDEEPQTPVTAPPSAPEVVTRSISPIPEFNPDVQGLLDSLDDQSDDQKLEKLSGRLQKDLYEYGSSRLATNLSTMLNSITTMKEFNKIVRSSKDKTIIREFIDPDSTNNKELPRILDLKTDAEIAEEFRDSTRKRVNTLYNAQIDAENINEGTFAKIKLRRREIATLSSKYADAEQLSLAFPAGDVTLKKMAILQKIKEGYTDEEVVDPMFENSLQPRLRF